MPTVKQMIKALGYTIITFGSSHLIVSYILMIVRDPNEGNLFRILNFQKVVPGIDYGWKWFVISNIIAVGGYLFWLGYVMYKNNQHKKKAKASASRVSNLDAVQGDGEARNKPYAKVR